MLLYELAMALDMRSPDLVDAARELGLGDLQAGSDLDGQQVAALRARFGQALPPPLPPAAVAPDAPSAASAGSGGRFRRRSPGPETSPPPPSPASTAGPAIWAAPAPVPVPDPAPVADAPPAAEPTRPGPPPLGPATWGAPAAEPAGPQAPAHWGPPPGAAGTPPAPPPVDAAGPAGPGDHGAPMAPPTSGGSGLSKGQMAAVGVVALLAVSLFVFMAMNSGHDAPDAASARDGAGSEVSDEPVDLEGAETIPMDGSVDATAPDTTAAPALDALRNETEYCNGVRQVSAFLLEFSSTSTTTLGDLQAVVGKHQASVTDGMALIAANGPPSQDADAAIARSGFDEMFASAMDSTSEAEAAEAFSDSDDERLTAALDQLFPTWEATCS